MRQYNKELRLIADTPAASIKLSETSGNPGESYHWRQMDAVRRQRQHEVWRPCVDTFDLTLAEMTRIETQVRRER